MHKSGLHRIIQTSCKQVKTSCPTFSLFFFLLFFIKLVKPEWWDVSAGRDTSNLSTQVIRLVTWEWWVTYNLKKRKTLVNFTLSRVMIILKSILNLIFLRFWRLEKGQDKMHYETEAQYMYIFTGQIYCRGNNQKNNLHWLTTVFMETSKPISTVLAYSELA